MTRRRRMMQQQQQRQMERILTTIFFFAASTTKAFLENEWLLDNDDQVLRFLQSTNDTSSAQDNTTSTGTSSSEPESLLGRAISTVQKWGFAILAVVIAFMLLFCYCSYRACQKRRERQTMERVNTQADQVLGDMAMVPTSYGDDDDDGGDGELL